jgi:hypothetical protein
VPIPTNNIFRVVREYGPEDALLLLQIGEIAPVDDLAQRIHIEVPIAIPEFIILVYPVLPLLRCRVRLSITKLKSFGAAHAEGLVRPVVEVAVGIDVDVVQFAPVV